jgi:hypothetical protein
MMLSITRSLARELRATFKKAVDVEFRNKPTSLAIRTDGAGMRIQARTDRLGVERFVAGAYPAAECLLPFGALADFEGSKPTPVEFSVESNGGVRAEWADMKVPQRRTYAAVKDGRPWLETPADMTQAGDSLIAGLNDAMSAGSPGHVKFATNHVQLRSAKSEIVGTDGHQLLIVRGVAFPWTEDLLVPSTRLLDGKVFTDAEVVELGRTDDHVVIRAGAWTVWLTINKVGRFPNVDMVIPRSQGDATRMILSDDDARFLASSLPRLPSEPGYEAVTVHLNGAVVVRAKGEEGPLTELVLNGSRVEGKEVLIKTDRVFLRRAAQLGIRNLRYVNDATPIVGETADRLYVWVPLPAKDALRPTADCVRIESNGSTPTPAPSPQPQTRPEPPMNNPSTDRHEEHENETVDDAVNSPIEEADAIRVQLREVLGRVNRLVVAIKRQRKQAQLVKSTLASLKQLQEVA